MKTFPGQISSKLPKVGTTIFTVMSTMANENKAINLSQGFPDFNCAVELIELVNLYMRKGYNQYPPMPGVMNLREAIALKTEKTYSAVYDPDTEITVTSGATEAIYAAITAVVGEGDEVIIFEPAYDCYIPSIKLNGGIPVYVQLKAPDYPVNWEEVKKLVSSKTRMIIINSPHNPTGSILSAQDMMQLDKLTENSDIVILSDEVYEHIIFDAHEHQSVARFPNLASRSFLVSSFGKIFHNTGWKIGYCLAPKELMTEFRKMHQFIVFTSNTPIQYALADYLKKESYLELNSFYQQKRDFFNGLLTSSKFKITPSSGTYFQSLDYSNATDECDMDFAVRLTKENKIASIPISAFYHDGMDERILRFCFAKEDKTLEAAAEILCKV